MLKFDIIPFCNYTLGEGLFLDLYLELGQETFTLGMGNLYRKALRDDPDDDCEGIYGTLCHLQAAFIAAVSPEKAEAFNAIIDRWYHGK